MRRNNWKQKYKKIAAMGLALASTFMMSCFSLNITGNVCFAEEQQEEYSVTEGTQKLTFESFFDLNVQKFYIPASVSEIEVGAFLHSHISEFIVDENNQNYCSVDGVLYSKDMKTMVAYPSEKDTEIYKMPQSVEKIENNWWDLHAPEFNYMICSSGCKEVNYFPSKAIYFSSKDTTVDATLENYYKGYLKENDCVIYAPNGSAMEQLAKETGSVWVDTEESEKIDLEMVGNALNVAVGVKEQTQDLNIYVKEGNTKVLYDMDDSGSVTLDDVMDMLQLALGIEDGVITNNGC